MKKYLCFCVLLSLFSFAYSAMENKFEASLNEIYEERAEQQLVDLAYKEPGLFSVVCMVFNKSECVNTDDYFVSFLELMRRGIVLSDPRKEERADPRLAPLYEKVLPRVIERLVLVHAQWKAATN